jgi:hypothetical protein
MDINIITVYQSPNYGSFLQALSLYNVIGKKYSVKMVNAKIRKPFSYYVFYIKKMINAIISFNFKYFIYNFNRLKFAITSFKLINTVLVNRAKGVFIFGSDEIWNLKRTKMRNFPILWGKGINSCKKISYAPSINICTADELVKYGLAEELKNFLFISVRDEYSKETIQSITDNKVHKVLDPTMLFNKEHYLGNAKVNSLKDYIAVYLFEVDPSIISQVKEIAKLSGKKLVSLGIWASWCDETIVSINPFDYYINADFVITNTFHGTAFAINLEKQFITYSRGMKKISELLIEYNLSDRDATGLDYNDSYDLLKRNIDYNPIRRKLDENREYSLDYLYSSIEKAIEEKAHDTIE